MKHTLMILASIGLACNCLIAQPAGGRQRMTLMDLVTLSDSQKTRLNEMHGSLRQDMQLLKSNESITVKEQRDQREMLLRNHRQQVQSLLTPQQMQQLEAAKTTARSKRLTMMANRLNLTSEQKNKFEALHSANWKQMEAIRNNPSMDRLQRQQEMKKLHDDMHKQTKLILTPDQLEQWKTWMQSQRQQHVGHMHRQGLRHHPHRSNPLIL